MPSVRRTYPSRRSGKYVYRRPWRGFTRSTRVPYSKFTPTISPTPGEQGVEGGLPSLSEGYFCGAEATYFVEVDWENNGTWSDPYDDVSDELLQRVAIKMEYGRDAARALLPLAAGRLTFELCDKEGTYDDQNPTSPLAGQVKPGRPVRLRARETRTGLDYILFNGFIDDIISNWNRVYSTVPVTATDGLASRLQGVSVSTEVHEGIKTGDAIEVILDAIDWPALKRDIDTGSSTLPWFWADGMSAYQAIQRIVACEGPPALAYIDPTTGNFVFEDRQHRLLNQRSQVSQATFCVNYPGCGSPDEVDPLREFVSGSKVFNAGDFPLVIQTSSAVQAGDTLIVIQGDGWGTLVGMPEPTVPGVDLELVTTADSQTNDPHIKVWRGEVASDGVQSVSVGQASAGNSDVYVGVYVFDGDTDPVIENADGAGSVATTANHVAPSVDAIGTSDYLICAWLSGSNTGDSGTYTLPDDMVLDAERDLDPFSTMAWAHELLTDSGSTGTRTAVMDGSSQAHVAVSLVVRAFGSTCPDGAFGYADPFEFNNRRQNIINHAEFIVTNYRISETYEDMWKTDIPVTVPVGETLTIPIKANGPFVDAFAFFVWTPSNTTSVNSALTRTSGTSAIMSLTAVSGDVSLLNIALRARPIETLNRLTVEDENSTSIAEFERSTYAPDAPWAGPNDAAAIAMDVVERWGERNPTVRLRVLNCDRDLDQLNKILSLLIGDRVTIINRKVGLAEDFIIERVERTITGRGKLHDVVFTCERAFDLDDPDTVFRFDTAGHGFDDGLFGH